MQNSLEMFMIFDFDLKYLFGYIWSKNSKLFIQSEIWYLDQLEYVEFNGGVYWIFFRLEMPFLGKFSLKIKNCLFQLKFDT